jgi:hypothetical protein
VAVTVKPKRTGGAHGIRRSSFRTEAALAAASVAALAAAVVCWTLAAAWDSDRLGNRGSGLFVLGAALVFSAILVRMRGDTSVWKLPLGPSGRRVFLAVLGTLVAALALGELFALVTGDA